MQCLQKTSILDFNPNTFDDIRKSYGLHKQQDMINAISILVDWVKQQSHFTKHNFNWDYLERVIISNKGYIERAKERMDKMCTYRTLWPKYFSDFHPREDTKIYGDDVQIVALPKLTKEHYRIVIFRSVLQTFQPTFLAEMFRFIFTYMEYLRAHDYVNGYILVVDFSKLNLTGLLSVLNITEMRQCLSILIDGYNTRLKGMHLWSDSKLIDMLVKIIKQVVSAKIGERIHSHSKIETIYECVPKDLLPIEYGGEERPLKTLYEEAVDVLSSKEQMDYKREMDNARVDETLRQDNSVYDTCLGIPGTFRSLSVD